MKTDLVELRAPRRWFAFFFCGWRECRSIVQRSAAEKQTLATHSHQRRRCGQTAEAENLQRDFEGWPCTSSAQARRSCESAYFFFAAQSRELLSGPVLQERPSVRFFIGAGGVCVFRTKNACENTVRCPRSFSLRHSELCFPFPDSGERARGADRAESKCTALSTACAVSVFLVLLARAGFSRPRDRGSCTAAETQSFETREHILFAQRSTT